MKKLPILCSKIVCVSLWFRLGLTATLTFLAIPRATSEDIIEQGIAQLKLQNLLRSQQVLKSYTGAVFVVGTGTEATSVKAICETRKASPVSPEMPTPPQSNQERITCSSGSQDITEEVAAWSKGASKNNRPLRPYPQWRVRLGGGVLGSR
jgi:Type IV pilin-like G and H, putative